MWVDEGWGAPSGVVGGWRGLAGELAEIRIEQCGRGGGRLRLQSRCGGQTALRNMGWDHQGHVIHVSGACQSEACSTCKTGIGLCCLLLLVVPELVAPC